MANSNNTKRSQNLSWFMAQYMLYCFTETNNQVFEMNGLRESRRIPVELANTMAKDLDQRIMARSEDLKEGWVIPGNGLPDQLTETGKILVDELFSVLDKHVPDWNQGDFNIKDVLMKQDDKGNPRFIKWMEDFEYAWQGMQTFLISPYTPSLQNNLAVRSYDYGMMSFTFDDINQGVKNGTIYSKDPKDPFDALDKIRNYVPDQTGMHNVYPLRAVSMSSYEWDEYLTNDKTNSIRIRQTGCQSESVYDLLGLGEFSRYMTKSQYQDFRDNMLGLLSQEQEQYNDLFYNRKNDGPEKVVDRKIFLQVMEAQKQRVQRGIEALDLIRSQGKQLGNFRIGYNGNLAPGEKGNNQFWVETGPRDENVRKDNTEAICFLDLFGNMGQRKDLVREAAKDLFHASGDIRKYKGEEYLTKAFDYLKEKTNISLHGVQSEGQILLNKCFTLGASIGWDKNTEYSNYINELDNFGSIAVDGERIHLQFAEYAKYQKNLSLNNYDRTSHQKMEQYYHAPDDDAGKNGKKLLTWYFTKEGKITELEPIEYAKDGKTAIEYTEKNTNINIGKSGKLRSENGALYKLGQVKEDNGELGIVNIVVDQGKSKKKDKKSRNSKSKAELHCDVLDSAFVDENENKYSETFVDHNLYLMVKSAREFVRNGVNVENIYQQVCDARGYDYDKISAGDLSGFDMLEDEKNEGELTVKDLKDEDFANTEKKAINEIRLKVVQWADNEHLSLEEAKVRLEDEIESLIGHYDLKYLHYTEDPDDPDYNQNDEGKVVSVNGKKALNPDRRKADFNPVLTFAYSTLRPQQTSENRVWIMENLRKGIGQGLLSIEDLRTEDTGFLDNLITYDEKSAVPASRIENKFQRRVALNVEKYLKEHTLYHANTVEVSMDKNGIISYSGKMDKENGEDTVLGQIGQIPEMDEFGLLKTGFYASKNYHLAGSYRNDVLSVDKENTSLGERTRYVSMEDQIMESIYRNLDQMLMGRLANVGSKNSGVKSVDDIMAAVSLNKTVRHMEGVRHSIEEVELLRDIDRNVDEFYQKHQNVPGIDTFMDCMKDDEQRRYMLRAYRISDPNERNRYLGDVFGERLEGKFTDLMPFFSKNLEEEAQKICIRLNEGDRIRCRIDQDLKRCTYNKTLFKDLEPEMLPKQYKDDKQYGFTHNVYGDSNIGVVDERDWNSVDPRGVNAGVKKQGSNRFINKGAVVIGKEAVPIPSEMEKSGSLLEIYFMNQDESGEDFEDYQALGHEWKNAVLMNEVPVRVHSRDKNQWMNFKLKDPDQKIVGYLHYFDAVQMPDGTTVPTPNGFLSCRSLTAYASAEGNKVTEHDVDPENFHGAINKKVYNCPIVSSAFFAKNVDDIGRSSMSQKNFDSGCAIEESNTAYVAFGSYCFEDGVVISKKFADQIRKNRETVLGHELSEEEAEEFGKVSIGQKIIDMSGNKGVVAAIVDTDWTEEEAKEHHCLEAWKFFRINPDLDMVQSMHSLPSRQNVGAMMAGMDDHPMPLNRLDGSVQECGMIRNTIIISDKTAEEKTTSYDSEKNEGRQIRAQGLWPLQCAAAARTIEYLFSHNEEKVIAYREKLRVLGFDLDTYDLDTSDRDYQYVNGIRLDNRKKFPDIFMNPDIKDRFIVSGKDGDKADVRQMRKEITRNLNENGGYMPLPFPLDFEANKQVNLYNQKHKDQPMPSIRTPLDPDGQGPYKTWLMPVMASKYRKGHESEGEMTTVHDTTKQYADIYVHASKFRFYQMQLAELSNNRNVQNLVSNFTPEHLQDLLKHKGDYHLNQEEVNCLEKMNSCMRDAQSSYNKLAKKVIEHDFDTKNNFARSKMLAVRGKDTGTAIWSANGDLELNEIMIGRKLAQEMGLLNKKGELVDPDKRLLIWRDPMLDKHNMASMKVKISDDYVGIGVNPLIVEKFQGDFDGDTVGLMNVKDRCIEDELAHRFDINRTLLNEAKLDKNDPEKIALAVGTGLEFQQGIYLNSKNGDGSYKERLEEIKTGLNDCHKKLEAIERERVLVNREFRLKMDQLQTENITPEEMEKREEALKKEKQSREQEFLHQKREQNLRQDQYGKDIKRLADDCFKESHGLYCLDFSDPKALLMSMYKNSILTGAKGKEEALPQTAERMGYEMVNIVRSDDGVVLDFELKERKGELIYEENSNKSYLNQFKANNAGIAGGLQQKAVEASANFAPDYALTFHKEPFQGVQQMKKGSYEQCQAMKNNIEVLKLIERGQNVEFVPIVSSEPDENGNYPVKAEYVKLSPEPLTVGRFVELTMKVTELMGLDNLNPDMARKFALSQAIGYELNEDSRYGQQNNEWYRNAMMAPEGSREREEAFDNLIVGSIKAHGERGAAGVYKDAYSTYNSIATIFTMAQDATCLYKSTAGRDEIDNLEYSLGREAVEYGVLVNPQRGMEIREQKYGEDRLIPNGSLAGGDIAEIVFAEPLDYQPRDKNLGNTGIGDDDPDYMGPSVDQEDMYYTENGQDYGANYSDEYIASRYSGDEMDTFNSLSGPDFEPEFDPDVYHDTFAGMDLDNVNTNYGPDDAGFDFE